MPLTPTYPGVYVEEIPSGVRAITGVATSITAFIGRAKRGPTNTAEIINGYGDFERVFGGLWLESRLGYALRDFFLNGGSKAVVVRLFHARFVFADDAERQKAKTAADEVVGATTGPDPTTAAQAARAKADLIKADNTKSKIEKDVAEFIAQTAESAAQRVGATPDSVKLATIAATTEAIAFTRFPLTLGALTLEAASEGKWGVYLRGVVDQDNLSSDVAQQLGVATGDLFNLTIRDTGPGGVTERFLNLTVKESPRRIDRVLAAESRLVRWRGTLDPAAPPTIAKGGDTHTQKLAELNKALADAQKELKALPANAPAADVEAKKNAVTNAQKALDTAKQAIFDSVSDGTSLSRSDFLPENGERDKQGLFALEQADLFNLLCIPPYMNDNQDVDVALVSAASAYCEKRRAMLLVDAPSNWNDKTKAYEDFRDVTEDKVGTRSRNAALFFPRLKQPNPLRENRIEEFVPSGVVAGVIARTDAQRGVWKAPAGLDATLVGVPQLEIMLTDAENGDLNPLGINCLRAFPEVGRVIWGARTLRGADQLADEYKYIPVRRMALFIEESLYRGLKWVVFEPNDEPLWAQIRLNVGAFMHNLFRQGAFQGQTPRDAYFVKCDKDTTTQSDINLGIVNIHVGFAPLKPAEFVFIKLQQMAGQIQA